MADAELTALAEHGWQTLSAPAEIRVLVRCAALVHLTRWQEASEILSKHAGAWSVAASTRVIAERLRDLIDLHAGRPIEAFGPDELPSVEQLRHKAGLLCRLGDAGAAIRLLNARGAERSTLSIPDAVSTAHQLGDWDDALRLLRLLHTDQLSSSPQLASCYRCAVSIHVARGQFQLARRWLTRAHERGIGSRRARSARGGIRDRRRIGLSRASSFHPA